MPNQLLGQHFLKDPSVVTKMIAAVAPSKGDTILEVGPGRGELTMSLATVCEKIGVKIIAVEKDQRLAEDLKTHLQEHGLDKTVTIVQGDILLFINDAKSALFGQSYKIIGNIPYYLTGHLLRIVGELERKPLRSVFTIQREVAERMTAKPPRMNRLAASVQFWATPTIAGYVPKESFFPVPKVDSAVIVLETKIAAEKTAVPANRYYGAVRALFAQPRKTILNNVMAPQKDGNKNEISRLLGGIGVDPAARPQNLSTEAIVAIAKMPLWG